MHCVLMVLILSLIIFAMLSDVKHH